MDRIVFKCIMCGANLKMEGITKIVKCQYCGTNQTMPRSDASEGENYLARAFVLMEDGQFIKANQYFEKALDEDAFAWEAYLGKVMAKVKIAKPEDFWNIDANEDIEEFFKTVKNASEYDKAIRFAGEDAAKRLIDFREKLYNKIYERAKTYMDEEKYDEALELIKRLYGYKDTVELHDKCQNQATYMENEGNYQKAIGYMDKGAYNNAVNLFKRLKDYKDSAKLYDEARYKRAIEREDSGEYMEAIVLFEELGDYKDSKNHKKSCEKVVTERRYQYAKGKLNGATEIDDVIRAKEVFNEIIDYKDSRYQIKECDDEIARLTEIEERKNKGIFKFF